MRIARLGTAVIFAIGSYGLSAAGVEAAPMPEPIATAPAAPSVTGTVTAPRWQAGSTWEYSDGYALRVRDIKDGVTTFERLDAPGQWFSMHGFLRQDASSADSQRQTIYRTVAPGFGDTLSSAGPLTFRREYLSNNELIVHASSWTVEGRERITVPAGTFDCWVIVWRERSLRTNWTGFERWWYSPEAQQYVRMEYKYGEGEPSSRVLMRYRLASGAAAISRPTTVPALVEAPPIPAKREPVDRIDLSPVVTPPEPIIPIKAPDPALPPLSREDRDPPPLRQISLGIVRMSPVFLPPLTDVAIEAPPAPVMKEVPIAAAPMAPVAAAPLAETVIDRPVPALSAVAMVSPVFGTIDVLPMAGATIEAVASPLPQEIALPAVAMDRIDAMPMTDVAVEQAASELAMLWPTDRIDAMRKRVMPYYDPDPFLPMPPAAKPEPATGIVAPLAFIGRMFRGLLSIFG